MSRSPRDYPHYSHSPVNQQRHVPELCRVVPEPDLKDRDAFSPTIQYPEFDRFPQERTFYTFDRHRYHLRQSEIYTMAEAGKFRAISLEDLESYVYSGDRDMMHRDLHNLECQELIKRHASRYPNHVRVITLTSRGKRFLQRAIGKGGQEFYSGLKKVRELRHDTAFYRIYQANSNLLSR